MYLVDLTPHSSMKGLGPIPEYWVCLPSELDGKGGSLIIGAWIGYRIGRVRVIFSLPGASHPILFPGVQDIPKHLAYIEWYTAFTDPDPDSFLYKISPLKDRAGGQVCSIIPLANIRRSVQLIPKFGAVAPQEWTSSTVLDLANTFFVNNFTDRHLYRIIC
jgi:hypothetical protein